MKNKTPVSQKYERTCLVGLQRKAKKRSSMLYQSMLELEQLVDSAGGKVVHKIVQERDKPTAGFFIGKGKAEEIAELCKNDTLDLVVFDDDLSPGQQHNLEEIIGKKVLDRTGIILDIFAQRARTKEGKLQVELAQLNYVLPRLVGKGLAMSQLGGGIGTRGPGETQLEVDRRTVRKRITKIKSLLQEVRKHRKLHRAKRKAAPIPVVALVGYTNAGKSSLLNRLTGAHVLVENQLFATLDPTTRKIRLPSGEPALMSDTVGFIRKLPHDLVDAFKATLEEVSEATLLLHVIDIAHPDYAQHITVVDELLKELGVSDKTIIQVLNKTDVLANAFTLSCLKAGHKQAIALSAHTGAGVDELLDEIDKKLCQKVRKVSYRLGYAENATLAFIYNHSKVVTIAYEEEYLIVDSIVKESMLARIEDQILTLSS